MTSKIESFDSTMKNITVLMKRTDEELDSDIREIESTLSTNEARIGENSGTGLELKAELEEVRTAVQNGSDQFALQLGNLRQEMDAQGTDFGSKIDELQTSSATHEQNIGSNTQQLFRLKDITGKFILKSNLTQSLHPVPVEPRRKKSLANVHVRLVFV